MAFIVELKHVSREFGDQVALDDVSFGLEPGEFACLVGPSGAGKTTLLGVINRQHQPTRGEVWVDGIAAHRLAGRHLARLRRRVATVFQDHKLLPQLTALENVAFAGRVLDLRATDAEVRERSRIALHAVEMDGRADAFPRQLSYGQCQRVALARALVTRPALLLADEPTGNLDEKTAGTIVELLERISQRGSAVLLATHNLDTVRRLQGRVLTLDRGRLVGDGATLDAAPQLEVVRP